MDYAGIFAWEGSQEPHPRRRQGAKGCTTQSHPTSPRNQANNFLRTAPASPNSPVPRSSRLAGSGVVLAEAKVTSKTDNSPANRGWPLNSIAIESLVNEIEEGSSWLLASFTTFEMPTGRPVNFSTNPLNPLGGTVA